MNILFRHLERYPKNSKFIALYRLSNKKREFYFSSVRSLLISLLNSLSSSLIIAMRFHMEKKIMGEVFQCHFSQEMTKMLHCTDLKCSLNFVFYQY